MRHCLSAVLPLSFYLRQCLSLSLFQVSPDSYAHMVSPLSCSQTLDEDLPALPSPAGAGAAAAAAEPAGGRRLLSAGRTSSGSALQQQSSAERAERGGAVGTETVVLMGGRPLDAGQPSQVQEEDGELGTVDAAAAATNGDVEAPVESGLAAPAAGEFELQPMGRSVSLAAAADHGDRRHDGGAFDGSTSEPEPEDNGCSGVVGSPLALELELRQEGRLGSGAMDDDGAGVGPGMEQLAMDATPHRRGLRQRLRQVRRANCTGVATGGGGGRTDGRTDGR
eukprot:SAG22_NODE_5127_length_1080_cov_25.028542_1_plen_279_part_01